MGRQNNLGQLCCLVWPVEIPVMTDKQLFQLVVPLLGGAGCFILLLLGTRVTGDLNRYTWKALLASAGLLTYAVYLTFWQDEIKQMWWSRPVVLVFGLLLSLTVPCGLFYWIWRVQVEAKAERVALATGSAVTIAKTHSSSAKLFRSAMLAWGIINSLGLLMAIISAFFRKP